MRRGPSPAQSSSLFPTLPRPQMNCLYKDAPLHYEYFVSNAKRFRQDFRAERRALVRQRILRCGYPCQTDQYVRLTEEELASLQPTDEKTISWSTFWSPPWWIWLYCSGAAFTWPPPIRPHGGHSPWCFRRSSGAASGVSAGWCAPGHWSASVCEAIFSCYYHVVQDILSHRGAAPTPRESQLYYRKTRWFGRQGARPSTGRL